MEFKSVKLHTHVGYIIGLYTDTKIITNEDNIIDLLKLRKKEYLSLAFAHGGFFTYGGVKFENKEHINNFANYLNENYLLVLRLTGVL